MSSSVARGTERGLGLPTRGRGPQSTDLASRRPVITGMLALALSIVLGIWTLTTATVVPIVGSLQLPLASTATIALSVGGYVLTPLGTIAAYAWDQTAQRRGLRNRNFGLMPQYTRILRYGAGAGFIVAAWHILNIANAIAGGA